MVAEKTINKLVMPKQSFFDSRSELPPFWTAGNMTGMPPELAGASPEPKIVQSFADIHVSLPLIPEFSGPGNDFGVHILKF